jgi:restriction system protein
MASSSASHPAAPSLAEIASAVRALGGEPVKRVRALMNAILEQAAAMPPSFDWSRPEQWIDRRLDGELRALAHKLWQESGRTLNPRYLYVQFTFIRGLRLLEAVDGIYRIGERGRRFLGGDDEILRELVALRSAKRRGKAQQAGSAMTQASPRGHAGGERVKDQA